MNEVDRQHNYIPHSVHWRVYICYDFWSTSNHTAPLPQFALLLQHILLLHMSSASNPSDAEKGIPEQEPFPSSLALSTQSFASAPSSAPSDIKPPGLPAEGGSPRSSVLKEKIESKAVTVTTSAVAQKSPQPKKASRYTRFRLWFNTYRSVHFLYSNP